jgi:HK97 family phage prohead protease
MPDRATTADLEILGPDTLRAFYCGDVRVRDRQHADVKWRASGDPDKANVRVLTGYPAVFNQATVLYEGKYTIIRETIAEGFFDDVLGDDCHLNFGHDPVSAMCRNSPHMPPANQGGPGSMDLSTDSHGLRVHAQVPMDDIDAQRIAPKMDRGVIDQMSFAFSVAQEDCLITEDDGGRTIYDYTLRKAKRLCDITVCALGAYSQTEAALRSAFALNGRSLEGRSDTAVRFESKEGRREESRSIEGSLTKQRAVLEVEAALATVKFQPRQ